MDPGARAALSASAARIDELADEARARAALVELHAGTAQWRSPAARACFSQVAELTITLDAGVTRLHGLAALLRRVAAR